MSLNGPVQSGDDPWSSARTSSNKSGLFDDISMISLDQIYLLTRTMPNTLNRLQIYDAEDVSHVATDFELDEASALTSSSHLNRSKSDATLMLAEEVPRKDSGISRELINLVEEVPFGFGIYFRLAGMCETARLCYHESLKLDHVVVANYMEDMGVFGRLDRVDQAHYYTTREVFVKSEYRHPINQSRAAQLSVSIRTEKGVELYFRSWDLKVFSRSDIEKIDLGELVVDDHPASQRSLGSPFPNLTNSPSFYSDSSRESLSLDSFVDLKHELNQIAQSSGSNSSVSSKGPILSSQSFTPENINANPSQPPNNQLRPNVFQQVGYWLYGTKLGQYVANAGSNRPEKTNFAALPIWLLGIKYDLKPTNLDSFTPSEVKPACSPFHLSPRRPFTSQAESLYRRKQVFLVPRENLENIFKVLCDWVKSDGWLCDEESRRDLSSIFTAKTLGGNKISFVTTPYDSSLAIFDLSISIQEHLQPCKAFFAQTIHRLCELCSSTKEARSIFQEWSCAIADGSLRPPESDIASISFDWIRRPDSSSGLAKYEGWCYFWDSSFGDWIWCFYEISAYGSLKIYNGIYLGVSLNANEALVHNESSLIWFSLPSGQEYFIRLTAIHEASLLASRLYQLSPNTGMSTAVSPKRTLSPAESFRKSYEHLRIQTALERKAEIQRRKDKNANLLEEFLLDFSSRFWFTYRRDMPRLVGTALITTDAGWGCMLRCGQMIIAETYARVLFGRGWNRIHLECGGISQSMYTSVVGLFEDALVTTAPFGIHSLVAAGTTFGHPIGQWFSPTLLVHVLRAQSLKTSPMHFLIEEITNGCIRRSVLLGALRNCPILLLAPMRLGVNTFNHECYKDLVTGVLELKQSVGIIGGLPGRSFHIVGHQAGQELFYLDPHQVKGPAPPPAETFLTDEYHTRCVMTISPASLDPSMIFGFLVQDVNELEALLTALSRLNQRAPVFSFLP